MPRTLISVNPLLPLTSLNNNTPSQKMEKENPISPSLCFPPPKTTITSIDLSHEWREEKDTKSSHLRRRSRSRGIKMPSVEAQARARPSRERYPRTPGCNGQLQSH